MKLLTIDNIGWLDIGVTLKIDVGQARMRMSCTELPVHFCVSDMDRVVDVECLEVLGDCAVEVQIVVGDMPGSTFRQRPDDGGPSAGKLSCDGLVIPARQGFDIFASRDAKFAVPSFVRLCITQRFVLRAERGG